MRKFVLTMMICLAALATWSMAAVFHGESSLEGAYEYVRLDTPEGPNENQQGMLIVQGDYMCHIRVSKERETISRDDSDEERTRKGAAIFRGSNGTCGTFTVEAGKATATWKVSVQPGLEGNSSEFIVKLDGDTLTLAPAGSPDFKFVYKRLE